MSQPSASCIQVETTLRSLVQTMIDSQEGFQQIADLLDDEILKIHFLAESLKRAEFRGQLEATLHREGLHDIHETGSVAAAAQRLWAELKARLGGSDRNLVSTAVQLEEHTAAIYETSLKDELTFPVRQMLTSQSAHVQSSIEFLRGVIEILA